MSAFPRSGAVRRWLFPLLVALLVLGHVCELPAYAELIASPPKAIGDATPVQHEHDHDGDEHALTCDGAPVVAVHSAAELDPGVVMAVGTLAPAPPPPRPAPWLGARPIGSSAGPPLFLLFSSFLL